MEFDTEASSPKTVKESDPHIEQPEPSEAETIERNECLGMNTVDQSKTAGDARVNKVELNAEFNSFLELRDAIERYQREKSVQLIVKDSKLLKAESTRKVIPKVYHLVNQALMYHSITYCCKCHGELKQKAGTRVKNVGAKRLNCPMYFRLKLTADLQRLVLFDIDETHNHGIDPTTCQMTPRQQVYTLSRMRQGKRELDSSESETQERSSEDVCSLIASAIKDVSTNYHPPSKMSKVKAETPGEEELNHELSSANNHLQSPLDSESSCSDSDEEEFRTQRQLLSFPIRLIGSAIQSSPELLAASKQLIEVQKSKLQLEKQKLLLQTRNLELWNMKLELEVKKMERSLASDVTETENGQDTTIYLQAS